MFCLGESDTFYLYPYPTDMRKSFYSLSGIVTNEMKRDVREWLNYFFTHIHDYDEDYSRDLLELLPHNLKQKGIL